MWYQLGTPKLSRSMPPAILLESIFRSGLDTRFGSINRQHVPINSRFINCLCANASPVKSVEIKAVCCIAQKFCSCFASHNFVRAHKLKIRSASRCHSSACASGIPKKSASIWLCSFNPVPIMLSHNEDIAPCAIGLLRSKS